MGTWIGLETSINIGFLLKEDGSYLLLEDSGKISLNYNRNVSSIWVALSKSA